MRSLSDHSRLSLFKQFVSRVATERRRRCVTNQRLSHRLRESAWIATRRPMRVFICFAIILNMLMWPSPGVTVKPVFEPVSALASSVTSTASSAGVTIASVVNEIRSAPTVVIPIGPTFVPVPSIWPFQIGAPRELTLVDRTARVAAITIAPNRFVGYIGETVTFVAMGSGVDGKAAHGAKFTWESSDTSKLTVDE